MAADEGTRGDNVVPIKPDRGPPSGNGAPLMPADLAERIARLEASIEGLRHSQNLTIGATAAIGGVLAAMIVGFGVYGLQRIDQTQESISREVAMTRQELVGVATAIANSITAARQMQPPIIISPAPNTPPSPSAPSKGK